MNKAAINICIQVSVWTCFSFSWVSGKSRAVGSQGKCKFCLVGNCESFSSGCAIQQQCMSIPAALRPCQRLLLESLKHLAIPVVVYWYLIVV